MTALGLCAGFASASPLGKVSSHRPRLSVGPRALARVEGLAPGDRAERTLELRYRARFAAVVLRTRTSGSSLLRSNATGLRLVVERCSKRWTRKRGTRSYSCGGKRWSVLKTIRVSGKRKLKLKHLSRRAGRTDHLRLTVSLPRAAGNASQGQTTRVAYRLIGVAAG